MWQLGKTAEEAVFLHVCFRYTIVKGIADGNDKRVCGTYHLSK